MDGDRVVGQTAVQKDFVQVDGETFEAGWAVDIMILPSHRGAGIGHRMHEAVANDVGILMAIVMADASRRMAERQGCVTLAEVHQLTLGGFDWMPQAFAATCWCAPPTIVGPRSPHASPAASYSSTGCFRLSRTRCSACATY